MSRELLPPAIDEEGKRLLYDRAVGVSDAQLQARRGSELSIGPVEYPTAAASSYTSGTSAAEKMRQRLERIRLKKKEAGKVVATERTEPELRRMRGKQRPSTQWRAATPDIAERRMPEDAVRLGDVGKHQTASKQVGARRTSTRCQATSCCGFGCKSCRAAVSSGAEEGGVQQHARRQIGARCLVINCFKFGCTGCSGSGQ